jgi:hypothetical protein
LLITNIIQVWNKSIKPCSMSKACNLKEGG